MAPIDIRGDVYGTELNFDFSANSDGFVPPLQTGASFRPAGFVIAQTPGAPLGNREGRRKRLRSSQNTDVADSRKRFSE
jgi:hypothetical protein